MPLDDLLTSLTGETLSEVSGLVVSARDLYLDGFRPQVGTMYRAYQLVPGAAIGGVLACENGDPLPAGGGGVDPNALAKWYYHYNDLGTVAATTRDDGTSVGVSVPDFFGNYRFTEGHRPDTMGLTGKFHDSDTGLHYFGARWYDAERGRWMSEEPLGLDGPNLYQAFESSPGQYVDVDGYAVIFVHGIWSSPEKCWTQEFMDHVGEMLGQEHRVTFGWSGKNCIDARRRAAAMLALNIGLIRRFFPDEEIIIVAHSHGGNVSLIASHQAAIDSLFTLGTPIRGETDHQPNFGPNGIRGRWWNVWSTGDRISRHGGPIALFPLAKREHPRANNIRLRELRTGHSDLHTIPVWDRAFDGFSTLP